MASRDRSAAVLEDAATMESAVVLAERLLRAGLRIQDQADEVEAARRRLEFLLAASQRLAATLDEEAVLETLADVVVPVFADALFVTLSSSERNRGRNMFFCSDEVRSHSQEWTAWPENAARRGGSQAH